VPEIMLRGAPEVSLLPVNLEKCNITFAVFKTKLDIIASRYRKN
jgi:hypothetical protein